MSRAAAAPETVTVRPTWNVYSWLVVAAFMIQAIGVLVIFMRASSQFDGLL